jgi:hypothetical protein
MRKLILVFFLSYVYLDAYDQIIKGTISDIKTKNRISYASVYFNGTTVGTVSGEDGNFIIDISKYRFEPLTISSIGYYSATISYIPTDTSLIIYLTPKVIELQEIVIEAKSLVEKRKENLELFKNEFLGTSVYAKNCVILNENDIHFNYGKDDDTLKAFASPPILIDNKLLGYKIKYYLDYFEYFKKSKSFIFKGTLIFKEDSVFDQSLRLSINKRRKEVYLGSRMHFFRALWDNKLKSNGFNTMTSNHKFLKYQDLVFEDARYRKFLHYNKIIYVYYNEYLSEISLQTKQVYFFENGYFDGLGIIWQGEMLNKRTGDMLPYEYEIKD